MQYLDNVEAVIQELNKFVAESVSGKKPVINQRPMANIINDLNLSSFMADGGMSREQLQEFCRVYLESTTRLHHPSFLSHQVAVPQRAGTVGALIDSVTNNAMAIYEMGPAATSVEYFLINWLLEKVGWTPSPIPPAYGTEQEDYGGGVLMHGGSLANFTAMLAARNHIAPEAWKKGNPGNLAILAPTGSHYSNMRTASMLGIGQDAVYHLEVDDQGAINPAKITAIYEQLKNDGKRAMALIANACSTAVGIYDPLQEIGDFCREKNIWMHVDGAHGATVLLSKKYRNLMKGVALANSITWDAHKMMRVSGLCSALLVRDHKTLDTAFSQDASYLFHEKEQPGYDFCHRTVECTKAGLGLKFFLVLASIGERGLSDYIERQFELTKKAYNYIQSVTGFTCPLEPQSNILCFRIDGSDELQLKIRDKLNAEGGFFLSTTLFKGVRYLRMALMNPHTDIEVIKTLIDKIAEIH